MIQKLAQAKLLVFTGMGALATAFAFLMSPISAMAQLFDPGRDSIGALREAGAETDIRTQIERILNFALGFLGLVVLVIIIYGGFLILTAAGNEEHSKKGKKIIRDGAIGAIIIVLAFAITQLIFAVATGGTQGGTGV